MKKMFLLIVSLISLTISSQNNKKFNPGVKLIENKKIESYKSPKSILFIFKGDTHLINYYLDLKKRIRKTFKKKMKKDFKNFKLNFNYNLTSKNPYKFDLENIPSKNYSKNKYESICYISMSDFKGWDNNLLEKRKQNYNLNIELTGLNSIQLMTFILNVNSYFTIITQNKNSSKLIYKTLMEN
jgi:hypothetical protein